MKARKSSYYHHFESVAAAKMMKFSLHLMAFQFHNSKLYLIDPTNMVLVMKSSDFAELVVERRPQCKDWSIKASLTLL